VVIRRGQIWWADLGEPRGAEPALRGPVLVLQVDSFNRSNIGTVVVVSLTSNIRLAGAPGNVLCRRKGTGLSKPTVVNVSQIATLERRFLLERMGSLPPDLIGQVEQGVKLVLGM
jgi:mRNA interferase MazF